MPVKLCSNGKWKIGDGPCQYETKAKADAAYRAYLAKKRNISASVQEMASDVIRQYIDPVKYDEIKALDPAPLFKVFTVGQEGESHGKVLGMGSVIKRWVRAAIQMMADKLNIGTKVFGYHGADNEHDGRIDVGEIVGKTLQKIGDKLSVLGIAYIKPEYRKQNFDIASIEADILMTKDKNAVNVVDIKEISGVALGNSAIHKPGFPGATLQGTLQEMAEFTEEGKTNAND
jgi:hypothetical protein